MQTIDFVPYGKHEEGHTILHMLTDMGNVPIAFIKVSSICNSPQDKSLHHSNCAHKSSLTWGLNHFRVYVAREYPWSDLDVNCEWPGEITDQFSIKHLVAVLCPAKLSKTNFDPDMAAVEVEEEEVKASGRLLRVC